MKIAALADLHYAESSPMAERRSELAPVLLRRAVARLNRFIRPDVTVLLGDLLDRGADAGGSVLRAQLLEIVAKIKSPVIVLPGNHDGGVDAFYGDFERPPPWVDVGGVRFVSFVDPEEPGWNARRTEEDLARLRAARAGWDGEIVCLQHMSLHPPGSTPCPYNLTNAGAAMAAMRDVGARLSIGGHYHAGIDLVEGEGSRFLVAPGLCERPFAFLVIELDGDRIASERHDLALGAGPGLFDHHIHTQFAYCSRDMDIARAVRLGREFGLEGLAFAEHSGQLYFGEREYWRGDWFDSGMAAAGGGRGRMGDYVAAVEAEGGGASPGLEVDFDGAGRRVLNAGDLARAKPAIGSVHILAELRKPGPDLARAGDEFLALTEAVTRSGVGILAHPFRVFPRAGQKVSSSLFGPVVRMLREAGVAAEVNFHGGNDPPREFFRLCIEAGVRLAFGSDAHELREVGDFWPHLGLLEDLGVSDPQDVLVARDDLPA